MDPSLSFHKNCNYVTYLINKRNNMLKALAGNLSQDMLHQAGAPTQVTRALRDTHSADHLHQESLMLKVWDSSYMLSAQYLVNSMEDDHICHGITTQEPRPRPMNETLHPRHHSTVIPRLGAGRKENLQNLHTHAVDSAPKQQQSKGPPIPISGRGTETEPEATMHYLTATIRTRPYTVGLQA